ncbi:MAG: heme o synthase [Myxococcaceae bacterium]
MMKTYYYLTKPGIIMGNLVTTAGGFFLASKGVVDYSLLLATFIGLALVIGSACVLNNYTDQDIDRQMERTKNRALVTGVISGKSALIFAAVLGFSGFFTFAFFCNWLTAGVALVGFLIYVLLYAMMKLRSIHGTFVGSLAGAVPPVIGYCSVSNRLDIAALLLFVILVFWQMPHFFAIALYRFQDYFAASIPLLPVKKGFYKTKIQMHLYIIAFCVATLSLTYFGYAGYLYSGVALFLSLIWLILCIKGLKAADDAIWARGMFRFSLVVITVLFSVLSIDGAKNSLLVHTQKQVYSGGLVGFR